MRQNASFIADSVVREWEIATPWICRDAVSVCVGMCAAQRLSGFALRLGLCTGHELCTFDVWRRTKGRRVCNVYQIKRMTSPADAPEGADDEHQKTQNKSKFRVRWGWDLKWIVIMAFFTFESHFFLTKRYKWLQVQLSQFNINHVLLFKYKKIFIFIVLLYINFFTQ